MTHSTDCVLGSGPAAVACASRLLDAGRSVIMVDPNLRLPPDRQQAVEEFRANPDIEGFVARRRKERESLPDVLRDKKLPFSSPYVYADAERFLPLDTHRATIARSLASGGLSAVWGATVIPLTEHSFRDWPVTQADMAPFYRAVAQLMDVPCPRDDLERLYPNFGAAPVLPLSEQGTQLMSHMLNHRRRLAVAGITFGRGRSAIGKRYAVTAQGCVGCGLCMYGCPYRAIFNAEYVVDTLRQRPGFTFMPGRMAEGYEEGPNGVVVRLRDLESGAAENLSCARLFVACGASTSLRLVAGAMKWFDRTFYLRDTQQFSVPVFLPGRCRAGRVPQSPALSQVFIEINDPSICDENIHLQVYGFNPFMVDILRARWGGLINERLLQPLFDRMMIVMGYLPGRVSGKIAITVRPSVDGLPAASCTGAANPRSAPTIRAIGEKLGAHRRDFGFFPALPLIEIPAIGTSAHLAGCLPMKRVPEAGETDALARPFGSRRVHVVDGACFPGLPSEHLTYTIMANAARIAAQSTERMDSCLSAP